MPLVPGCLWAQMRSVNHIETHPGGREEVLDDISEDFPYLSVLSQHDRYYERTAPWHWQNLCIKIRGKLPETLPRFWSRIPILPQFP